MNKLKASLSLDLDNQWSYMKIHGEKDWNQFPSYFEKFIPMVLKILGDMDLSITFFIVGQDAALDKNRDILKELAMKGHEVGNHSFHHETWLHLYGKDDLKKEILETEEFIFKATGKKTIGFRGPGYSWSRELLEILIESNYLYDASTLPTFIGPLARFYYFRTSELDQKEKKEREYVLGSFRDGFRSVKPYYWKISDSERLLEIPVTTIPIFKVPFHLNYLIFLSRYSERLMNVYLEMAIKLCKVTKTEPSFLLHPLDLISGDLIPEMAFFPGMDVPGSQKMELFYKVIGKLSKNFNCVTLNNYAKSLQDKNNHLNEVTPKLYS
jgi:hypothetical protein